MVRQPVDLTIVGKHLIFLRGGANEPAFPRILDEGILLRAPTKRIIVAVLLLMVEQAAASEIARKVLIALFYPTPTDKIGRLVGELAVGADAVDEFGKF